MLATLGLGLEVGVARIAAISRRRGSALTIAQMSLTRAAGAAESGFLRCAQDDTK
jgi:hypothetical protein